jgi:DNA (cytosine-5)-methyltransferase 1
LADLKSLGYIVEPKLLNAAHFGVPQNRERIIVVGHQGEFDFPDKMGKKVTAGEALGELVFQATPQSKFVTPRMDEYIARYEEASNCAIPRDLHLHKAARTLTCRNLAGRTGDMHRIRLPDGRRRLLSVREAARLQSFPDWFEFCGSEASAFYQIGNAVPPLFSFRLAEKVREFFDSGIHYPPNEIKKRQKAFQIKRHSMKHNA